MAGEMTQTEVNRNPKENVAILLNDSRVRVSHSIYCDAILVIYIIFNSFDYVYDEPSERRVGFNQ